MVKASKKLAILLIIGLVASLAACSPSETGGETRQLMVGASAAPDSLDPTTADAAAIPEALLYNVYETLVKIDFEGNLAPLLASEWEISDDRTSYTFHLVEAKFANGNPVNADAVVASMKRIMDDEKVLPIHKDDMSAVESVTAVDERTVEFKLSHPSNDWFYAMTQSMGIIFDPTTFDDLSATAVGSGPFKVGQWVKGDSLELLRNDNYWDEPTTLPGVTFKYYTDPNAENAALLSGSLDVISNVAAPQALDQFDDPQRFVILDGTTTGEIVLGFNHQTPALQNLALRQAINYAIDREALRDAVWAGKGALIGSMVPPTDPWYEDLYGVYPYDPQKAKELVAESGLSDIKLRLRIPTLPYAPPAASYIASQLAEVGIDVEVEELQFPATWIDEVMKKSNYDMTIVAHVQARDLALFANPDYYWHYDNPEFQQLIEQADQADEAGQIEANKQAAQILADDAAACFLWLLPHIVVTKADITGIHGDAPTLSFDLTEAAIN